MTFSFLGVFTDFIEEYFSYSIMGHAKASGALRVQTYSYLDFIPPLGRIDRALIGGGAGQLLCADIIIDAISQIKQRSIDEGLGLPKVIFLTPVAKRFSHKDARRLAELGALVARSRRAKAATPATSVERKLDSTAQASAAQPAQSVESTFNATCQATQSALHQPVQTTSSVESTFNSTKTSTQTTKAIELKSDLAQVPAHDLAHQRAHILFVTGRYEGFDERALEVCADELFSIGDFILSSGDLPALILADAIARQLPGVLGNAESLEAESFEGSLLAPPEFARPRDKNFALSLPISEYSKGNHSKIKLLKRRLSLCKSAFHRPDLLEG